LVAHLPGDYRESAHKGAADAEYVNVQSFFPNEWWYGAAKRFKLLRQSSYDTVGKVDW
jgi:hypothetical protein